MKTKLVISSLLLASNCNAETWDILEKWKLESKSDQTQELVWNTKTLKTEVFIQRSNALPTKIYSMSENSALYLNKYFSNEKQGIDYANNMYFGITDSSAHLYKDNDNTGDIPRYRYYNLPLPFRSSGNVIVDTDGRDFPNWTSWSGATDGNVVIKVANANVSGDIDEDTKNYTHVFVYNLDSNNLPANNSTIEPVSSFRISPTYSRSQVVQGAEVANGKVYVQLGGFHPSNVDHRNVILEYTLGGTYIQTHHLQAHKVIHTGLDVEINPKYLKVEYEGLMVKNGILYTQVFYGYGHTSQKYKSVIYEVLNTARAIKTPTPELRVERECTGNNKAIMSAAASTGSPETVTTELYKDNVLIDTSTGFEVANFSRLVGAGMSFTFKARSIVNDLPWSEFVIKSISSSDCIGVIPN